MYRAMARVYRVRARLVATATKSRRSLSVKPASISRVMAWCGWPACHSDAARVSTRCRCDRVSSGYLRSPRHHRTTTISTISRNRPVAIAPPDDSGGTLGGGVVAGMVGVTVTTGRLRPWSA